MKRHTLATAFGVAAAMTSTTILLVSPAYGQSCTPSSEYGGAAHSGASLTNPAGETIVVTRRGERGLDASASAANHGTIITCGDVNEYYRDDGTPARRRAYAVAAGYEAMETTVENTGRIETWGRGARGLQAWTEASGGTARATNSGRVVTRGEIYDGTEHFGYTHLRTPDGLTAFGSENPSRQSDATAVNEASGEIEVHGTGARGIWAWTSGPGEARGINRGQITTHGDVIYYHNFVDADFLENPINFGSAAGISAWSGRGNATAINEQGGTIRTHGDGVSALFARIQDADKSARAENHGTIVASGDSIVGAEGVIDGVAAGVHARAEVGEGVLGTAEVFNTGDVTVSGSRSVGLYADTAVDSGNAADVIVRMTGGSVTAGVKDNPGTPVDESRTGWGIVAESENGRARVTVSGDSTTVTAYSATTDDPATYFDESESIGIAAVGGFGDDCWSVGSTCSSDTLVEISEGATVTADIAVAAFGTLNLFESRLNGRVELDSEEWGSNDHFTIRGGSVHGDVNFYDLDDRLTIQNHGYITGDVDFGDGMDTLVFDVNEGQTARIDGAITGIEEMYKRGSGTARVRDVTFSGSALALERGGLTLAGHLNLGADGTLTVHDESRLTIEVGDITRKSRDHGRITAGGGVIYEGLAAQDSPTLFMQIGADAEENREAIQARLEQEGTRIDVLGDDTEVMRRADANSQSVAATATLSTVGADGTTQNVGTLASDGTAVVDIDEDEELGTDDMLPDDTDDSDDTTRPRVDNDGSSNAGALLIGGGAAAALAVYLFDLFDSEEAALVEWDESWTGARTTTSFAGIRSGHYREHRVRTGALEQWTRAFAGDSSALAGGVEGTVQGIAMGLDATLPHGFNVGASMMPHLAASAHRGASLNFGANVEGARYAVHGGWRGEALFFDTNLSHGSYRTQSFMENPAVGGLLGGELGLTQNHAQGRAGMRLDLGRVLMMPSVSLFSGSLAQGAHIARDAAVKAEVPGLSQRYAGWRAKLDLAPSGWLDGPGALSWRPSLQLSTTRTRTSGPSSLEVQQADHEGVLSFASRAAVKGLPRTVHGIGASLVAARSDAWNFRMGYVGMVVDGEPVHAAVARLMIRF